jgi:hypothetical protein
MDSTVKERDKFRKYRGKFTCKWCTQPFDTEEGLESHLESRHGRYSTTKHLLDKSGDKNLYKIFFKSRKTKKDIFNPEKMIREYIDLTFLGSLNIKDNPYRDLDVYYIWDPESKCHRIFTDETKGGLEEIVYDNKEGHFILLRNKENRKKIGMKEVIPVEEELELNWNIGGIVT